MNRINTIFRELRQEGRTALMPFVTAGYPSLEATEAMLSHMERAGASVCELGIPFSDPIADGPVIQASMTDALAAGVRVDAVLEMVRRVRPTLKMALVAMISYSIVYRLGAETFIKQAADAGLDGFIFPDLPVEEAEAVGGMVRDAGLTCTLLIAPTTPLERAKAIAQASSGFVYVLARTGITGERSDLPADLSDRVAKLRQVTDLPIAVGFGVSQAQHVRAVTEVADAAIVGSALVKRIAQVKHEPPNVIAEHVGTFVADLAEGLCVRSSAGR
ncbi:MAG: tryptophan synthase subunit alpha [Phycisphaeraceae bacterium]